jgi:hypothetical protein
MPKTYPEPSTTPIAACPHSGTCNSTTPGPPSFPPHHSSLAAQNKPQSTHQYHNPSPIPSPPSPAHRRQGQHWVLESGNGGSICCIFFVIFYIYVILKQEGAYAVGGFMFFCMLNFQLHIVHIYHNLCHIFHIFLSYSTCSLFFLYIHHILHI